MRTINNSFTVEEICQKSVTICPIFEQILQVLNQLFTRLKNWYSVSICIDSIQNRPISSWLIKYRSYLAVAAKYLVQRFFIDWSILWRHDIQHNDTQRSDIHHKELHISYTQLNVMKGVNYLCSADTSLAKWAPYRRHYELPIDDTQLNVMKGVNYLCYAECLIFETLSVVTWNGKQSTVNKSLDGSMYPG